MRAVAVIAGPILTLSVMADMVNPLVATHTARHRWWPTRVSYSGVVYFTVGFGEVAPRGFWGHEIGHRLDHRAHKAAES